MVLPLVGLGAAALMRVGVSYLGRRAAQAAIKKGGEKLLRSSIQQAQKSGATAAKGGTRNLPKVKVQAGVGNKTATGGAGKPPTSGGTTSSASSSGSPKKQSYVSKLLKPLSQNQKLSKSGSLAQASVIKRGAAKLVGGAAVGGGVGYALGKGNNKPTPTVTPAVKSKKAAPSQTPSEAKAMLEKKRAAAKERIANQSKPRKTIDSDRRKTPRQRMLDNENKRLKDRKYK
jgi:hypothetical protein